MDTLPGVHPGRFSIRVADKKDRLYTATDTLLGRTHHGLRPDLPPQRLVRRRLGS